MVTLNLRCELHWPEFRLQVDNQLPLDGITALFGPSGSGKSTLLRIVCGLEQRAVGRVALDDRVWVDSERGIFVPPHRRGVGYVFQDGRLFPHLSVFGNLRYADRRSRQVAQDIRLDEVVDALDLGPLLSRSPQSLSGGERQRVAMGRTLLTRPQLLLMDEPLSALDLHRKAAIIPYIEALPATFRVPIIYVTHAIDEVTRLARELILMQAGQVVAMGATETLLDRLDLRPLTGRFEAGSLLEGRLVAQDREQYLSRVDIGGQVLQMPFLDLPMDALLRLRIRARDVAVATEKPRGISIRNILDARIVEIVLETGSGFAELLLDLGGSSLRARITRAAVADLGLKPGYQVYALVKSVALDRRLLRVEARGDNRGL